MTDNNPLCSNRHDDLGGAKKGHPNLFCRVVSVSPGLLVAPICDGHVSVSFQLIGFVAHQIWGGSEDGNHGDDKIQIIH
jgi:hypothetical protein